MNLFFIEVYALLFIVHCSLGFENWLYFYNITF
jgi:hypothetical protein